MRISFTKDMIIFFLLLLTMNVYGQGTIQGVISDSLTGDPLVGANVYLTGTAIGAAVNFDGEYRITKIPFDQYRVVISYIGYKSKEVLLTINSEKIIELNIQLLPDILEGEEIIVSAQALGQAAAINQQLNSNTIVNVVSEQKIQELPDANAGESIGRLPGVSIIRSGGEASQVVMRGLSSKFSTVTINGVTMSPTDSTDRGIDLSTISQGSLAGIELYKAITADKDGDAIAGSVNLVTKKAPSERLIRIEPRGSYNGLDESAEQYNFTGRYGERFFNDLLGVQAFGNLEQTIRSSEETDLNYELEEIAGGRDYEITSFLPKYINEDRKRAGGSLLLDLNTPDNGTLRLNTIYNETSRKYLTSFRTYGLRGNTRYDYRDIEMNIDVFNSALSGENYFLGFRADWNLSFSESKRDVPLDFELDFEETSALDSTGNIIAGMRNVPTDYSRGPAEALIPYAVNNFDGAFINVANNRSYANYHKEKGVVLDLLRNYSFSEDITGEFKVGGKYREKSRYFSTNEFRATYYLFNYYDYSYTSLDDGKIVPKSLAGTRFENLRTVNNRVLLTNFLNSNPENRDVFDQYSLYPLINQDALKLWRQLEVNSVNQTGSDRLYVKNKFTEGDSYGVTERTAAGYLMNTLNIGPQITFIAGVRVENDDNDYDSKYTTVPLSGFPFPFIGAIKDTSASYSQSMVLPNFHAILRPFDFVNLRFAAYKAIARPDFNYRLYKFVLENSSGAELHVGKTDLKNALAWNYEIQTQFYGNEIGLFSVSAFYKDIKDMFHSANLPRMTGTAFLDTLGIDWQGKFPTSIGEYSLTFPYNSVKPTKVWGFEVEHQANFRFLPGLLKNIILNYNFTIVRSETWIASTKVEITPRPPLPPLSRTVVTSEKRKLENQPEFFSNVSLGYDYEGFSFRISLFYQGEYNRSFSGSQRDDGVQKSYTKVDIALKQQVTDYLSVLLNLNNITNTEDSRYIANRITGWSLPDIINKYGMSVDLGVRLEL